MKSRATIEAEMKRLNRLQGRRDTSNEDYEFAFGAEQALAWALDNPPMKRASAMIKPLEKK